MSCKSALYAANLNSQTLAAGANIDFGNIVRRYGCNCNLVNGAAVTAGAGYYDIDVDVTFTAGAAGTAVITLYKDNNAIPGASASITVENGSTYAVSVPAIVRQITCNDSVIKATISGVAMTVLNSAITLEKI